LHEEEGERDKCIREEAGGWNCWRKKWGKKTIRGFGIPHKE